MVAESHAIGCQRPCPLHVNLCKPQRCCLHCLHARSSCFPSCSCFVHCSRAVHVCFVHCIAHAQSGATPLRVPHVPHVPQGIVFMELWKAGLGITYGKGTGFAIRRLAGWVGGPTPRGGGLQQGHNRSRVLCLQATDQLLLAVFFCFRVEPPKPPSTSGCHPPTHPAPPLVPPHPTGLLPAAPLATCSPAPVSSVAFPLKPLPHWPELVETPEIPETPNPDARTGPWSPPAHRMVQTLSPQTPDTPDAGRGNGRRPCSSLLFKGASA